MRINWSAAGLCGLAAIILGCSTPASEHQTISGQVAVDNFDSDVIGVRAVRGVEVLARATIDKTTGAFSIDLPEAEGIRLEVVTSTGAHPFSTIGNSGALTTFFDVCAPGAPFNVGHVHRWDDDSMDPNDDGMGSDEHGCDDFPCDDPRDPNCCADGDCEEPPEECDDPSDPNCCRDGNCEEPPEECDDPRDPNCCMGEDCEEPPEECDDPSDPNCCRDGNCEEPPEECDDPSDPNCCRDGNCEEPPEECDDPRDPNCCADPGPDGSCWPDPVCEPRPDEPGDGDGEDPRPNDPSNDDGSDGPMEPNECWEDDGAVCEYALASFGCDTSN